MATLLTQADFNAVRAALDPALTADFLPDAIIGLDLYQGEAEATVRDSLSTADALLAAGGLPAQQVVTSAVLLTAALLCPALPRLTSENSNGYAYQRQLVPWDVLAKELRGRAKRALLRAAGLSSAATVPTFFATVGGRGGADAPDPALDPDVFHWQG